MDKTVHWPFNSGEMAHQVRTHDWTSISLGPVEDWPSELKFAVTSALDNQFPTVVAWGPDLVTIYNDGFWTILGHKIGTLGQSFSTIWAEAYRMSPDWSEMWQLEGQAFLPDTHEPSRTWLDRYVHGEDHAAVLLAIQEAIGTKSMFELEHRVIRVDGSLGWTLSRAVPILAEDGEISEWLGAARDTTAANEARQRQVTADAALFRSEQRLREFGEASSDVLWTRDARTLQWEYLTPAFETVYGLSQEQALSEDNLTNWAQVSEARDWSTLRI